jgi:hypothetical protein
MSISSEKKNYKMIYVPDNYENLVEYLIKLLGFQKYQTSNMLVDETIKKIKLIEAETEDFYSLDQIFDQKLETIIWLLDQTDSPKSIVDRIICYGVLFGDKDINTFNQWTQRHLSETPLFI